MDFLNSIFSALDTRMTTPGNYGWFHIMWVAILIVSTVLVCVLMKNSSRKKFHTFLWILWAVIILFEIYKQLLFTYGNDWTYKWYAFPFQLCSMPLYILPLALLCKDGKVKNSLMAFLATFSLFGGLCVYIFPNGVFMSYVGINIQTMVHHGVQILVGIYIFVWYRKQLNIKWFLSAIIPFAIVSAMAIGIDIIAHTVNAATSMNMFYISPYLPCTLPVLSKLYPVMPYWAFLIMYLIGFCFVAFLLYIIAKSISMIKFKRKANTNEEKV